VGTAVAAFVGLAAQGPFNTPTLVTNWNQFTQAFGEFVDGSYLAHSVYGYFLNGGGPAYIVRIGNDGADGKAQSGRKKELPEASAATIGGYRVSALDGVSSTPNITVQVADSSAEDAPEGAFKLQVKRGNKVEETFDPVTTARGKDNVVTVVAEKSKLIKIEETATGAALAKPDKGSVTLQPGAAPVPSPERIAPDDYVGDVAARTGFGGLEAVEEVTMLAVPDLMSAYQQGAIDLEGVKAVQVAMIAHCELMGDRMAILDPPPGLNPQQIKEWRVDTAGYDSKYAALYYPWITIGGPDGRPMAVPPSGHMAGIYARNDNERGVHKAPANEIVRGALAAVAPITKGEQDTLNPVGVNCIRSFAGRGVRVWGARTLSSDPAWRYINVRRLFNFVEKSIEMGTQWVVFEPNNPDLWARIRRDVGAFLTGLWREGMLFGQTPAEAFFVKCDAELNPSDVRDRGQLFIDVGLAPVKPAEFVIFRLSQFSGGGA
jgi:hypothetical protein